jgi:hypothetical protein
MHDKIEKNEAKIAKKRDEKIESWLEWANSLHIASRAEVGGKPKKTKGTKTMKQRTKRRHNKRKTRNNYKK